MNVHTNLDLTSKPIGKMYLVKNIKENKYIWRCSENTSHEIEFDYKQKF